MLLDENNLVNNFIVKASESGVVVQNHKGSVLPVQISHSILNQDPINPNLFSVNRSEFLAILGHHRFDC